MKQLVMLAGCAVVLSGLAGCQKPAQTTPPIAPAPPRGGVEVIIEGGGEFPQFLVGRWKADDYRWEFVFEPNGTISSMVLNMGGVEIIPGQTRTVPTRGGGEAIFEPGLWTVQYSPQNRELTVEIIMDHIHFEMGPQLLEGTRTDMFAGEVSEDGKIWRGDWFNFPDYIAHTSTGPKRLTISQEEESYIGIIIFRKIEEEDQLPGSAQ